MILVTSFLSSRKMCQEVPVTAEIITWSFLMCHLNAITGVTLALRPVCPPRPFPFLSSHTVLRVVKSSESTSLGQTNSLFPMFTSQPARFDYLNITVEHKDRHQHFYFRSNQKLSSKPFDKTKKLVFHRGRKDIKTETYNKEEAIIR